MIININNKRNNSFSPREGIKIQKDILKKVICEK
jgi:hypothetical protein